ncbi:MAG: hypothetical protein HYV26_14650 [Candidatus Hydrogenedentes bacterium]|nr:hypothetical protein [Candidatus Hydrogenedentota bacterium]
MSHLRTLSRKSVLRAESLLVMQQKVAIFAAFSAALNVLGQAIGTWQDLQNTDDGGDE